MSNEKKIIKEMVQGNLKVNRKRNLLLVLAITLTTILFTSVLEIGFGGMQSIQETQLRLSGLKADAELRYLNKEQFQEVQNSELFESVGGRIPIAFLEGETKRPIEIDYLDKGGMEAYYLSLKEGKMPEDEKEVLLSEQALEELGIKKEVGSYVPVSFTLRGQEYNFDMRLAGWYTGNPKADFLIVSETFLEHNLEVTKNTYDDDKEDGISAARRIRTYDKNVRIIYVTSHESYMRESFEVRPFQFLVKPVIDKIMEKCFKSVYEDINSEDFYFRYSYQRMNHKVPIKDILYFESNKRKIFIVTEQEILELYGKLNEIEETLKTCKISFLRVHQSFLVNYKHISGQSYDSVVMDNGQKISISEDRRKIISEQYCSMEDTFYVDE